MSPKMKSWYRFISIVLLLAVVASAPIACSAFDIPVIRSSHGDIPTELGVESTQALETVSQKIPAGQGATLVLPSGSRVTISPGIVTSNTIATLSLMPKLSKQFPNDRITSVGPSLSLSLTPGWSSGVSDIERLALAESDPSSDSVMEFQVVISPDNAAGFEISKCEGYMPILYIHTGTDDGFIFVPGKIDSGEIIATVSRELWDEVFSESNGVRSFDVSAATLLSPTTPESDHYGMFVWNGYWTTSPNFNFPSRFVPGKKTMVLIHGIFSSVQSCYDPSCMAEIEKLAQQTGCTNIVGFNYRWQQGLDKNGEDLAIFFDRLRQKDVDVPCIVVVAHSFGVPSCMAALSREQSIPATDLLSLGGVIMGTHAADTGDKILSGLLYLPSFLARVTTIPSELKSLKELVTGGTWISDMKLQSERRDNYRLAFIRQHPETDVIAIAGLKCNLPGWLNHMVYHGQPNDTWVDAFSADGLNSGLNLTLNPLQYMKLSHIELPCPLVVNDITPNLTNVCCTHTITVRSSLNCLIVPCGTNGSDYPYNQSTYTVCVDEHSDACFELIPVPVTPQFEDKRLKCNPSCEGCVIQVDGRSVGAVNYYTFTDVTADHTISLSCTGQ